MMRLRVREALVLIVGVIFVCRCGLFERREEDYEVFVEVEDVFCTEVVLRVGLPDSGVAQDFNLVRDDSVVGVYCSSDNDTVIIDGGLMPDRDYEYRVDLVDGGRVRVSSESVVVHTLDTTSHEVRWSIDTLGIAGWISDAWVVDEDDIWVVGNIVVPDPDSSFNGTGRKEYNAAHWNGEEWELLGIYSNTLDLYSIWYFDENNIWVTDYCSPIHWDGKEWKLYHLQNKGLDVCAGFGIWASSPDDIYFVGYKGSIVHYDGKDFEKLESGTDINLLDIDGTPDGRRIYICGYNIVVPSRSVVLELVDGEVREFYYVEGLYEEGTYGYVGALSLKGHNVYFSTPAGIWRYDFKNGISELMNIGGTELGDLFVNDYNDIIGFSGGMGYVHYNGRDWREVYRLRYVDGGYRGGCYRDGIAVMVGYTYDLRGIIAIGFHKR